MKEVMIMNQKEADRIKIISQVEWKILTAEEVSDLKKISKRQV